MKNTLLTLTTILSIASGAQVCASEHHNRFDSVDFNSIATGTAARGLPYSVEGFIASRSQQDQARAGAGGYEDDSTEDSYEDDDTTSASGLLPQVQQPNIAIFGGDLYATEEEAIAAYERIKARQVVDQRKDDRKAAEARRAVDARKEARLEKERLEAEATERKNARREARIAAKAQRDPMNRPMQPREKGSALNPITIHLGSAAAQQQPSLAPPPSIVLSGSYGPAAQQYGSSALLPSTDWTAPVSLPGDPPFVAWDVSDSSSDD